MKNIQLIAFFFCLQLFAGRGLYIHAQSEPVMAAFRSDYDFTDDEIVNSLKLNIPFFEFRGSAGAENKWNYGVSFSSKKLYPKACIELKTGNLSSSGSLSKLNSPALSSSVSPFLYSSLRTSSFEVSLPQYNSFSNPQSYFVQTVFKPNQVFKQVSLSAFYKDSGKDSGAFTSCFEIKFAPWKKAELSYCITGGLYPYKSKEVTSWFYEEKYYKDGKHLCFNNQFSVVAGNFSSLFIMSCYQSPFGEFENTWRLENLLKLKDFSFSLNTFYNPNNLLITSSDKKLKPLLQVSGGGQYKTLAGTHIPLSLIAGINTLAELNLSENNHSVKTAAGIRYSSLDFSGSLSTVINLKLTDNQGEINASFTGGSVDFSNSFYINDFTPGISGKFTFTPDSKKENWTFTEKIGINFEYQTGAEKISFSNKNQITFTQKTGNLKNKIAFTSSLTAKFQFRFCSLHVHLEFQE